MKKILEIICAQVNERKSFQIIYIYIYIYIYIETI